MLVDEVWKNVEFMYSKLLEDLSGAIGARRLIQLSYENKILVVEPHLVGKNKADEDCLYGWISVGVEPHKAETGWRVFLLKNISHFKLLEKSFSKARPGYDPYDNRMNRIYYRF
ncbi:hypothetical protein OB13_01840 [Pontibacter sp. HJ8]